MDVYRCIRNRRTVREFKPDLVPESVILKILQAGRWAPSSSNTQKWHFILVTDKDTLTELGRIATQGTFIAQAPMAIVVVMDDAPRPQLDAGRALQQMELMAWSEGLGTCFVGVRVEEQRKAVYELLNIPEEMDLITILPFGYRPDGPRPKGTPRKPMEEIAHREKFGEKYVPA